MKKRLLLTMFPILILVLSISGLISFRLYSTVDFNGLDTTPPSHDLWDALVKDFVKEGHVDYQRLHKNNEQLNIYLNRLSSHEPTNSWSREEQLAYWINAYNAFTLKIILDHYPVKSIKDIGPKVQIPLVNSTWDISFIHIGNKTLSLNDIEHRILRKEFNEPRIHFAIVCASKSCPTLRSEAYNAKNIDNQLNQQAISFINNKTRNHINANHIEISQIFNWFKGDFTKNGSLIDFLNKYSTTKINPDATISYLDYDWSIND